MGQEYTLDDIRQTQAYLLSEAAMSQRTYRENESVSTTIAARQQARAGTVAPLVTQGVDQSSISTPVQSNSGRNKFFELPQELTKKLKPEIKIYKTYILPDGKEYNYLLPMGGTLMNVNGAAELITGVVVKSAEFTRLGGNPAEIDTNIKFNLKLYAQNIHTFFNKTREEPNETYDPTPLVSSYVTNTLPLRTAISENTAAMQTLQTHQQYAADAFAVGIGIGPTLESVTEIQRLADETTLHQSQLDAITLAVSQVGTNGERDVAWIDLIKIDPGQPLNADLDATLAVVESDTRIKVEIGYAKAVDPPADFNGTPAEWIEWKEVIEGQREVFYLSLKGHQFDFKANGSIGLSIDYVASGIAKQLSPVADLFYDAESEDLIKGWEIEIEEHERELELANRNALTSTGGTTSAAEAAESRRESCIEGIEDQIEELENSIYNYRSKVRLRLLKQLYLDSGRTVSNGGQNLSRVFQRRYKISKSDEDEDDIKALRQTDINYTLLRNLNINDIPMQLLDLDDSAVDSDITIIREDDDEYHYDLFIFLGDIIESAVELLTPDSPIRETSSGETTGGTSRTTVATAAVGVAGVAIGALGLFTGGIGWSLYALLGGAVVAGAAGSRLLDAAAVQFHLNKFVDEYRLPFAFDSSATARFSSALNEFGGILTGTVTYKDPNAVTTGSDITIKISDIPISLDIFRAWWIDTYVKSGKKTLPLRDFINALMKFVEREVFDETPLNFGRVEEKINNPEFIVNTMPLSREQFSTLYNGGNTVNRFREVDISSISTAQEEGAPLNAFHLTTIETTDSNPLHTSDVPNIEYGETTKGVLKRITFEREDIPGHSEARLFSDRDSVASNIALREKYNSSLELIGNTCFLPGSLFYLNPYPLDVGYAADRESFARQLGLGGMYRVVNLTSVISFDDGMWNTKVNTKWESFGDGDNGTSDVVNPPPSALGLCIEAEIAWLERKRDANILGRDAYAQNNPDSEGANMTSAHAMLTDKVVRLDRLIVNLRAVAEEN